MAVCGAIIYNRWRISRRFPSLSEILLFLGVFVSLSLLNSYGNLLQYCLTHLIEWNGYNVHDLLIGSTVGQFDDFNIISSAWPTAALCCLPVIALCHFQERPIHSFLLTSIGFFGAITVADLVISIASKGAPPFAEDVLANALGAPFLGGVTTGLYFLISKLATTIKSPVVRPLLIFSTFATLILILTSVAFAFERIFLIPAPTYFEADITNGSRISMIQSPPKGDVNTVGQASRFDVLLARHKVGQKAEMSFVKDLSLKWSTKKKKLASRIKLFSATGDCLKNGALKEFRPVSGKEAFSATEFQLTMPGDGGWLEFPAIADRSVNFSAIRKGNGLRSYFTTLAFDSQKKTLGVNEFIDKNNLYVVQAATAYTLFATTSVSAEKEMVANLKFDRTALDVRFSQLQQGELNRCLIKSVALSPGKNILTLPPFSVLLVAMEAPTSSAPNEITMRGQTGFLDLEGVELADPLASEDEPLAQGNLGVLLTQGRLSHPLMYGVPVNLNYRGKLQIWGDSFTATADRTGHVSVRGTIKGVITDTDRLMHTPWELLDVNLQLFILGGCAGALGLLARVFFLLFKRDARALWSSWNY